MKFDQFCLFHCSHSASHEAQTGILILDLMRTERPCCVWLFCDHHFLMRSWQFQWFFFPTCSCACTCLGADRAADVLSAKNRTHVSLHSSKTVLNPLSSPVLLHCVAARLEAIYYALAPMPESLHKGSIWLFSRLIIDVYLVNLSCISRNIKPHSLAFLANNSPSNCGLLCFMSAFILLWGKMPTWHGCRAEDQSTRLSYKQC